MRKLEPGNIEQRLKKAGIDIAWEKRRNAPRRARAQMLMRVLSELEDVCEAELPVLLRLNEMELLYLFDILFELYDKEKLLDT